jgi:hypothetical protein
VFGTLMLQVHFTLLVLVQDYKKEGQIWIVQGKHFGNLSYFLFHFMNCCIFCVFLDIIWIEHETGFLWCVLAWKMAITLIIINWFDLVWILCFVCAYVLFSCFVSYIFFYFFCVLMWSFVEISNLIFVFFFFLFVFYCFWCLHNKVIHKIIKPKSRTLGFT